ncbi:hypothetical protein TI39_contig5236g00001 [Zymoseptoria brevis]|uniref:DUF7168 domain-containing protein n=1 Tax=Zymoseptoria brevis TaxID=1047168 RepID=A0A0F4G6B8_9PEZI|nr:hypothetical protein TI39_contig5236g00001 [Zymoseptoria brevis]
MHEAGHADIDDDQEGKWPMAGALVTTPPTEIKVGDAEVGVGAQPLYIAMVEGPVVNTNTLGPPDVHVSAVSSVGQAGTLYHSTVVITRTDGDPALSVHSGRWTPRLARVIETHFNTEFSIEKVRVPPDEVSETKLVKVTFYGTADDALASTEAFTRLYNQISRMAMDYPRGDSRISYLLGVCDGLQGLADREKEEAGQNAE